jgi:hypothetical protein
LAPATDTFAEAAIALFVAILVDMSLLSPATVVVRFFDEENCLDRLFFNKDDEVGVVVIVVAGGGFLGFCGAGPGELVR